VREFIRLIKRIRVLPRSLWTECGCAPLHEETQKCVLSQHFREGPGIGWNNRRNRARHGITSDERLQMRGRSSAGLERLLVTQEVGFESSRSSQFFEAVPYSVSKRYGTDYFERVVVHPKSLAKLSTNFRFARHALRIRVRRTVPFAVGEAC